MNRDDHIRQLHRNLFAELAPPPIPAELSDDAFLESVYARAAESGAARLGPVLEASLTPVEAPEDIAWREVEDMPDIRSKIERALPDGRAPGWLWGRVRDDMRARRAANLAEQRQSRRRAMLRLAAAAAILISTLTGVFFLVQHGTNEPAHFVFVEQPGMSGPTDLLLGRRLR